MADDLGFIELNFKHNAIEDLAENVVNYMNKGMEGHALGAVEAFVRQFGNVRDPALANLSDSYLLTGDYEIAGRLARFK